MPKKKNPAAVALGRKGGKKTAKRGKEYYAEIAKKSHAARKENLKAKIPFKDQEVGR